MAKGSFTPEEKQATSFSSNPEPAKALGRVIIRSLGSLFLLLSLMGNEGAGQCTNTSSYLSEDAPTNNSTVTISTCTYQGDYNTINNVVAGETYVSDNDCGGYITVRSGTYDGPVVASGNAPLTWTATVNGDHFIHYNTNSGCGTTTGCCETTITCTSCSAISGCVNTSSFGSEPAPTDGTPVTISTCTYQTNYNTISGVVAGETYVSEADCGGYITVRSGTYDGPIVDEGNSPLTWTATVNGDHFIHYNTNSSCGTATTCCETTITCTSCASCSDGIQNQGETGVDCGGPCPPCPTGPTLVPTACSNITHNMTTSSTLTFYDDGGPGGDPCDDAAVSTGNYCNCDCFTTVTICAAPGEYIVADFREFAMWNTTNGWDWMKIYDGANTGGTLMYDNSATGPENPMGDCGIEDNVLFFCSTGQCMTFEFWATSVVNRAGWDALISSTPDQCVPLPVELVEFKGVCMNGQAELSWVTATETNNDYFVLQRSKDGKEFEPIDRIEGAGTTSSPTEYAIVDQNPIGEAYYRLVQFDYDGESERSELIRVPACGPDEELSVTVQNNGSRTARAEIHSPEGVNGASISLLDTRGRRIWKTQKDLPAGASYIPIGEKVDKGLYILKVRSEDKLETERVLLD